MGPGSNAPPGLSGDANRIRPSATEVSPCVGPRQPCRLAIHRSRSSAPKSVDSSAATFREMTDSLMFSKLDADRILRRAGEIEGSEDAGPITADELRSIAGEAGFGSQAVERALAEAQQASSMEVRRHPVQKSGLVITSLSTTRVIPIEISSAQLTRTVRLFQPYREGPAQVELREHQITWRDRKGLGFTVTSAGGATDVRVFVSKALVRRGRWMGWVRSAADRLEALVLLVATQDLPEISEVRPPGQPALPARAGPER